MRLKNLSRWTLDDQTVGLLFFAQRLDELLFDYTLDTYKPPALNAPFLCVEAIELIYEIDKGFIEPANLEPVLEELTWSLQNDDVAKNLLNADINYYTLRNDETPLPVTKLRLEALGRTINSSRYLHALIDRLAVAVRQSAKREIDSLASSLVTTLINVGMSKQFIFNSTQEYFFSPDGSDICSPDDLDGFISLVTPKIHSYSVYFLGSSQIKGVSGSIGSFGLEILDELPEENAEYLLDNPKTENEVFIKVLKVRAFDAFSARHKAFGRLDNLSDLFTLFYHKSQLTWRPEALVVRQCCDKKSAVAIAPKGPMEKAFDLRPDKASKELNILLTRFSARNDRSSFQRFNRVADLHGICVAQDIADNQLVNLWTAIETLVPSHVGGSKIKQVIKATTPFVARSYTRRLLETLLFDLTRWDRWRIKKILNKVPSEKGASALQKVARLIASEDCREIRDELYGRLGDFHLLRYRCFKLSEQLATSKNIISMLDRHEKKVAWQLRRLYRARNLIVHTSRSPSYLSTLIENGHSYFDIMLFDVIGLSCGEYGAVTIEQSFELGAILYGSFRNRLNSVDKIDGESSELLVSKDGI
ncbi:hypothetical protein I6J77_10800 [Rhodanobacter sp. FDAARGOS 1247]|uniref:hypothetical protein n=1 Tax=Rhodanobacter sp. FDAARGOS 1247 TaxID=2778082 RepID=UPI00195282BE|nr:hypothetical protein [Rhodanobacter sp. FDAARGOS 1247]QRP62627.1 hypothetical protein I6J77_10800 [Rhodanobacter sp. FDAARGOS 1247]